jgi:hypothetical protein
VSHSYCRRPCSPGTCTTPWNSGWWGKVGGQKGARESGAGRDSVWVMRISRHGEEMQVGRHGGKEGGQLTPGQLLVGCRVPLCHSVCRVLHAWTTSQLRHTRMQSIWHATPYCVLLCCSLVPLMMPLHLAGLPDHCRWCIMFISMPLTLSCMLSACPRTAAQHPHPQG